MRKRHISTHYNIFFMLFLSITLINCSPDESEFLQNEYDRLPDSSHFADTEITDQEKAPDSEPLWLHGEILPHKGFEEALLAVDGIQISHAMELTNALRFNVDFRYLYAGERFKVKLTEDKQHVEEFIYNPNIITYHKLKRNPETGKYDYKEIILPTEKRHRIVEGTIETSLNQALIDKKGVSDYIRTIVNGVLECVVAFRTDARKGDRYLILIEEKFYKNKKVPGGNVLYVSYEGRRVGFKDAFLYKDIDPKSAFNAHYTREGKALIPSALRLPVNRVHVTSAFGYRRHPVTGRRSFHNGVDYGGPTGSPVYAVASGRVAATMFTPNGGNKVILRHADGTRTYYLHLHKILVKPGQQVRPRQHIAQLGSTGRVTGPHLHFSIKGKNGRWQNPLLRKMIATPQLKGKRFRLFENQLQETIFLLEQVKNQQITSPTLPKEVKYRSEI